MAALVLKVSRFAHVRDASIPFGDLTILVGPQATGKSLLLQLLKFGLDRPEILATLKRYGFTWQGPSDLVALFFGDGYREAWTDKTLVMLGKKSVELPQRRPSPGAKEGKVFYIPAHRTLAIADGWPLQFQQYSPDTPFVARLYSEQVLGLTTKGLGRMGSAVHSRRNSVFVLGGEPQDHRVHC